MPGRKPKPTALLKLMGTANVTRLKERGPEPEAPGDLLVEPPDWFSEGQAASWRYAVENAPLHILRRVDRGMLTVWCEAEDRHRRATEAQATLDRRSPKMPFMMARKRKGMDDPDGKPTTITELTISPYLAVITAAAGTMARASSDLGFSPAARPRLAQNNPGAAVPNDSPWHRLKVLQGGRKDPA